MYLVLTKKEIDNSIKRQNASRAQINRRAMRTTDKREDDYAESFTKSKYEDWGFNICVTKSKKNMKNGK